MRMKKIKISGIYKISDTNNNKFYIGSSNNIEYRIKKHFELLKRGKHHSIFLQRAYNKNGGNNFSYEILEVCKIDDLLIAEQIHLNKIEDWKMCYNMSKTASGCNYDIQTHPNRDAIIEKQRIGNLGKHTKPFFIDGVRYETLLDAEIELNIKFGTIANRIKSWKNKNYYYENYPKIGDYDILKYPMYKFKPPHKKMEYYCLCGAKISIHAKYCNECRTIKMKQTGLDYVREISIDGVIYQSPKIAARILGVEYPTLYNRLKSNTITHKDYYFVNNPKDVNKLTTIAEINKKISNKAMGNNGSKLKPF